MYSSYKLLLKSYIREDLLSRSFCCLALESLRDSRIPLPVPSQNYIFHWCLDRHANLVIFFSVCALFLLNKVWSECKKSRDRNFGCKTFLEWNSSSDQRSDGKRIVAGASEYSAAVYHWNNRPEKIQGLHWIMNSSKPRISTVTSEFSFALLIIIILF